MKEIAPPTITEIISANETKAIRNKFNQKIMKNLNQPIDLSKIWENTENLETLYHQLTDLKKCLDSFRPFSETETEILKNFFDIEYTYHSNKIEGNTLTKSETHLVINKGLTIANKSLNEHLEAINHKDAIDYIRDLTDNGADFTKRDLLNIHQLILRSINQKEAGKYRSQDVLISGSRHIPPKHFQINDLMEEYFKFYEANKDTIHPVELASEMHERLVTIHPFIDGNGRTSRLVMNLILIKNGYPITIIEGEQDKRLEYYDSLELIQIGEDKNKEQFKLLIANNVKSMIFKYLDLLASNNNDERLDKGSYFFKRIEDIL